MHERFRLWAKGVVRPFFGVRRYDRDTFAAYVDCAFEAALLMATKQRTPVIQRLGNMADEGAVVHIGGYCYKRLRGELVQISKADFDRAIQGQHEHIETWDPRGALA